MFLSPSSSKIYKNTRIKKRKVDLLIKASDFLHHFASCLIAVVMKGVS